MKQETGKLVLQGKKIMVELPTKKGSAKFSIPEAAKCFRDNDFEDGIEAAVERDAANRIVKVTIPGKAEVASRVTTPSKSNRQRAGTRGEKQGRRQPEHRADNRAVKDLPKASPSILGQSFHNPYTFIPFTRGPVRERREATLATVDETVAGYERMTGVLQLKIETLSPLMSCDPRAVNRDNDKEDHKVYRALTIGDDVIVPATGVRGALRTLMTILTGGTLGYLDRNAYLIQGRDAKLGPRPPQSTDKNTPGNVYLGEVVSPGNANYSGKIQLGETRLVKLADLERLIGRNQLNRSPFAKPVWLQLDENDVPVDFSNSQSSKTPWRLRLSGRPVGGRRIEERKREAVFLPNGPTISIPPDLWAAYAGRHAFGDRRVLRPNDLVWLEPKRETGGSGTSHRDIQTSDDIESLQWARWGKTGRPLKANVPSAIHPDSWNQDGNVDEVTNLFGQVCDRESKDKAVSFAARINPENLFFKDAKSHCQKTVLAPLAPPHPGCLAFYRNNTDPDTVDFDDMLRGYKVYRTSSEQGSNGPWNYNVQGVYDKGKLRPPQQKVNKTADLLPSGSIGSLRIAFHALCKRELAMLIQACHVPWRLGGGKPLGLGHCRVTVTRVFNGFGDEVDLAEWLGDWQAEVTDIRDRVAMWVASQQPVDNLRYPLAVRGNSRGGHAWFQSHARPRMVSAGDDGKRESGLAPIYIDGDVKKQAEQAGEPLDPVTPMLAGQTLPLFDGEDAVADLLYGYDMIGFSDSSARNIYKKFEKFDDQRHDMSGNVSYANQGKNAAFRKKQKQRRRDSQGG